LLKGVLTTALSVQALQPEQIQQVIADTTVQEKAIAFPTDARLYHKARRQVIRLAKRAGLKLRQTYERASQRALYWQARYTAAQQFKRAARQTRKLQVFLGRVLRDVQRKAPQPDQPLQQGLAVAQRIHTQQRHDSPKLYSVHAPEVECITKGKLHKKYEFGCKVAFTTTAHDNWIVGAQAHHDNPYDGATLAPALQQVKALTGVKPTEAVVDQGYRGLAHHPDGVTVHIVGRHKALGALQHLFKRRSAIEPIISHSKQDHGLARNHLLGQVGDKINALLSACGFNLRKLLHFFRQPLSVPTVAYG
jgi:IS5 family transposase